MIGTSRSGPRALRSVRWEGASGRYRRRWYGAATSSGAGSSLERAAAPSRTEGRDCHRSSGALAQLHANAVRARHAATPARPSALHGEMRPKCSNASRRRGDWCPGPQGPRRTARCTTTARSADAAGDLPRHRRRRAATAPRDRMRDVRPSCCRPRALSREPSDHPALAADLTGRSTTRSLGAATRPTGWPCLPRRCRRRARNPDLRQAVRSGWGVLLSSSPQRRRRRAATSASQARADASCAPTAPTLITATCRRQPRLDDALCHRLDPRGRRHPPRSSPGTPPSARASTDTRASSPTTAPPRDQLRRRARARMLSPCHRLAHRSHARIHADPAETGGTSDLKWWCHAPPRAREAGRPPSGRRGTSLPSSADVPAVRTGAVLPRRLVLQRARPTRRGSRRPRRFSAGTRARRVGIVAVRNASYGRQVWPTPRCRTPHRACRLRAEPSGSG